MPVANPEHRLIARSVLTEVWVCRNVKREIQKMQEEVGRKNGELIN